MPKQEKIFSVDTRPTKTVVVSSLTRDATVKACIFDLIDNSIDAARDSLIAQQEGPEAAIPSNYLGFEIRLTITGKRFVISDNCGGISREKLAKMVLRFGETSTHQLGIGVFGVGLNRALFKLGATSSLKTDTGNQRAELSLDVQSYLASDDWDLPAIETESSGHPGTEITISDLPAAISKDFADSEWLGELKKEIGVRYGQFLLKGLIVKLNKVPVIPHVMKIRENGPFGGDYKIFKAGDDVSVHIEYGQLNEHRFSNEIGYDKVRNKDLTDEFGWTVICNDRVILTADRSLKTGWETGFHSEFYGFAGIARFISNNPANLPWNTTKTDVDLNNSAYQTALIDMRRFATNWRAKSSERKKESAKGIVVGELPPLLHKPKVSRTPGKAKKINAETRSNAPNIVTTKPDHHEYRTLLPKDVNEVNCYDKLLALVHEAKRVDIYLDPYSALALLRMLVETTGLEYYRRKGRADDILDFAVKRRDAGSDKQMTPKERSQCTPSMNELLDFLVSDGSVWGATRSALRHSLDKMKSHQKILNGVLHNPYQQVPQHFAITIRDEVTPILRHLIEA
jgi:Histidine kinase-, DNA gyrase B-, and HSP90-like ATPase